MNKFVKSIAVATMAMSLVGCGTASKDGITKPTVDDILDIVDNDSDKSNGSQKMETIDFDDVTVVDNEECSIVMKDMTHDGYNGTSINVALENKSAEKDYSYAVEEVVINGVQIEGYMYTKVLAGKKSTEEIMMDDEVLAEAGIGKYTDIEVVFRVYTDDDWTDDDVFEGSAHIYPYGEAKAEKYVREPKKTDIVLIDNDKISFVATAMGEDEYGTYAVRFYVENKTDQEITLSSSDVAVNDYMTDGYFFTIVSPGKCTFEDMTWYDDLEEEYGIEKIESIEFKLTGYDDSWDGYTIDEKIEIKL